MTTIAFKDGVMAADSKCTDDHGAFLTKCRKIDRLANGALLGQSGDGDARELFALLGKATPKRLPSRAELAETKVDFHGILAFPNGRVFMVYVYTHDIGSSDSAWTGQIIEMEERICAVGSGQQFALGAMKAGRSAAEAVAIACHYDSYSQLPVKSESVKPLPTKRK